MTHPLSASLPAAEDSDLLAAELVEELACRLQAGEAVDLEAYARAHPTCADRIRRLVPAVHMLAQLGRSTPETKAANGTAGLLLGILGDFRLGREVGRGGMGIVYEAEQISLRRRVALKVLPFAAILDPRQLQRFHNEARAAACLHHPNIVPVYAVGTDRAIHYYAMQFIEGQTLAGLISGLRHQAGLEAGGRGRATHAAQAAPTAPPSGASDMQRTIPYPAPVPSQPTSVAGPGVTPAATSTSRGTRAPSYFRRVAQLGVQAAEALEHAHQQGVVHRDIKPANILLDTRGNLWITDFGLAQFQQEAGMTASGDLVGTLRYMSPEQARGGRRIADHRVDIYSLGVTLYELLALEHAFPGEDRQVLIRQITNDEPRPVRSWDPAVPVDLETIVSKAMAKEPDERYATAQELADDLKRFLDDRPIRARRPSLWQQGTKWSRRNRPFVWSLALFAVLAVMASLVGSLAFAFTEAHLAAKEKRDRESLESDQRDLAVKHFYALLDRAQGLRLEHKPGYRRAVWKDLEDAAGLQVRAIDLHPGDNKSDLIRDRALACLGDPIGRDPIKSPKVTPATRPEIPETWRQWLDGPGEAAPGRRAMSRDGKRLAYVSRWNLAFLQVQVPGKTVDRPMLATGTLAGTLGLAASSGGHVPLLASFNLLPRRVNEWGYWFCPLGGIYDLEFGPDSHTLVAGCEEGVAVWNLDDPWAPLFPLLLRSQFRVGNITSVAIHPGGRLLAIGGRQVELWSLDANQRIAVLGPAGRGGAKVGFSQDGKLLLATINGVETGWCVTETDEKLFLQARQGGVPAVAFSPDGTLIASGAKDGVIRVWEVATGRLKYRPHRARHAPPETMLNTEYAVESVAFSPDGKWLATGDRWELQGSVTLWDVQSGEEVAVDTKEWPCDPPGPVWCVRFSPSGRFLVAGGTQGMAVYKIRTDGAAVNLQRINTVVPFAPQGGNTVIPSAPPWVYDLAVHPGEEEVYFLNAKWKLCAAKLEGKTPPRELKVTGEQPGTALRGLQFDATGDRLTFITNKRTLALWDRRTGDAREAHTGRAPVNGAREKAVDAHHVAVGGGGRWIAVSSPAHEAVIYDTKEDRVVITLPPEDSDIWCLAWSPDGTHLAVGMTDGGIAIWDLEKVRQSLADFDVTIPSMR
jgi:serine/threonine protein kinase/WD40 repeat protein